MSFVESIKHVYTNYVTFKGRATRSEYWWFALFYFLVSLVLNIIDSAANLHIGSSKSTFTINDQVYTFAAGPGLLTTIFALATLLPIIAVSIRRLHDAGFSGWFLLLGIVLSPLCGAGVILLLVLHLMPSKEDNKYGPKPA
ncbi:MAG: DUF805 domain-containing protein [Candidatus Nanopelagicales bacterium]|nr:DUF805 domain-containing protein [Candidatus Nanopelagicales bacterium]